MAFSVRHTFFHKENRNRKLPFKKCNDILPTVLTTLDGTPIRKLFVGNLSPNVTEVQLQSVFSHFGSVTESIVIRGKNHAHGTRYNPRPNIFGFVTFLEPQDAGAALNSLKRYHLPNNWIVKAADSWHQPPIKVDEPTESNDLNSCEASDEEDELVIEDNDTSPISKLNDDCLLIIFSYFSLPHQIELFKVCRRWNSLLTSQWARIKELNFSTPPLSEINFDASVLANYLSQCPNLTSLDLSKQPFKICVLLSIIKHCKQLTKLSITGSELKHRSLALLAHHYPNLTSFSFSMPEDMYPTETNYDYEVLQFIKKSRSLEELTVKYSSMCSEAGIWLPYLKPPLRSLQLEGLPFEYEDFRQGILSTKQTLKEVVLTGCSITLTDNIVRLIVKELPSLTRLSLTSMFGGGCFELFPLANLKQLTYLSLEMNNLSDGLLEKLSQNCPDIHTLELIVPFSAEESGLSESGIKFLPNFTKLHHLNLSGNTSLTDSSLHIIANKCPLLSYLSLQSCSITDVGCISIVTQLNSLEFLDIRNCDSVSNATVLAAIEAYRGGNKKKMVIAAGHTDIDFGLNWDNPGVKLDNCTSVSGSLSSIMGFEGMMLLRGPLGQFVGRNLLVDDMFDEFDPDGFAPWYFNNGASLDDDEDFDDCFDVDSMDSDDEDCMYDFVW